MSPDNVDSAAPRRKPAAAILRSRLLVLLPFTFSLLTLLAGFLAMWIFRSFFAVGAKVDFLTWHQATRSGGAALIALGLLSFAVGTGIALGIRSSLRSLSRTVEQIAQGDFDLDDPGDSQNEITQLQSHFRKMAQAMNSLIQETGMGATISVDMTGKVRMVNSLAQLMLGVEPGEAVGAPFQRVFNGAAGGANAELVRRLEVSLDRQEPLREEKVRLELPDGRSSEVGLRTSFFVSEGRRRMAIMLLDSRMAETSDARKKIERAARFFTLGSLAATLAHEIRNPLGSLAGLAELLKEDDPDPAIKDEYIYHIEQGTARLNRLIEGLMDIAALEKCELSPHAPGQVVYEAVGGRKHLASARGVELDVDADEALPWVNCNREWLARALRNLVDNAVDATPEGGKVTVSAERRPVSEHSPGDVSGRFCVEFSVHNTGSFIPDDIRRRIFDPFETFKEGGTGLGLSIALEIVQAHGGAIALETDPEKGTRFAFRLVTVE